MGEHICGPTKPQGTGSLPKFSTCPEVLSVPIVLLSLLSESRKNKKGDANEKRNTWVMCFGVCFVYVMVLKLDFGFIEDEMVFGSTEGEVSKGTGRVRGALKSMTLRGQSRCTHFP